MRIIKFGTCEKKICAKTRKKVNKKMLCEKEAKIIETAEPNRKKAHFCASGICFPEKKTNRSGVNINPIEPPPESAAL